jgi:hypothetical protein
MAQLTPCTEGYGAVDYENYMELYEAVYFWSRICNGADNEIKRAGVTKSVYTAVIRILAACGLLSRDGGRVWLTDAQKMELCNIRANFSDRQNKQFSALFEKAVNPSEYFFDGLSALEYEIYSRCNYPVTFAVGQEAAKHIDFSDKRVLELGGNSGGFGAAVMSGGAGEPDAKRNPSPGCMGEQFTGRTTSPARRGGCYTVVDTPIPCAVGREFNETYQTNIAFIEGNVFELSIPRLHGRAVRAANDQPGMHGRAVRAANDQPGMHGANESFDYIVMMNLLHDFDDEKCRCLLRSAVKYCGEHTRFIVIEDILSGEWEPKAVILHGLRLSVNCRGGRQRTAAQLAGLFADVGFELEKTVKLNDIHTLAVMGK